MKADLSIAHVLSIHQSIDHYHFNELPEQDSWEDSDEEAAKPAAPTGPPPPVRQKGITKSKIAEKEAAEKAKLEAALASQQEDPRERRKLELQMQMAQDLESARSLFGDAKLADAVGGSDNPLNAVQNPKTKQDYKELSDAISKAIVDAHGSKPLYPYFVEELVRSLCLPLKHLDAKQVNSSITALSNEKQKQEKDAQGGGKKGKKGKPQLGTVGAGAAKSAVTGRGYAADLEAHDMAMDDDFDDFVSILQHYGLPFELLTYSIFRCDRHPTVVSHSSCLPDLSSLSSSFPVEQPYVLD